MMKKLTEMVKGTKTEHQKNMDELNLVHGAIAELDGKLNKFKTMLQGAQLELELGEDAGTKKRIKKIQDGIDKLNAEIGEHQKRAGELQHAINTEKERQRVERLESIAQADAETYERATRSNKLREQLRQMQNEIESNGNNTSAFRPNNLLNEVGLKMGYFRADNSSHAPLKELWEEKKTGVDSKVDKELEALVKQIQAFLNK